MADPIVTAVITEAAKATLKPVYDSFMAPGLESLKGWLKKRKMNLDVEVFETKFVSYLNEVFLFTENINVLVFPGEQIALDDFYEPLTIISQTKPESYVIDGRNLDFLLKYKKIIISDAAGMGKSTLMKWITRKSVINSFGIPILIELRKITQKNSLLEEIASQLKQLTEEVSNEFILQLLSIGSFIIIFDGYDEIALDNQDYVTDLLLKFVSKARNNYFILTSRPDSALAAFGNFKMFKIKPLAPSQYNSIIKKCDNASGLGISKDLIADIKERGEDISSFLSNPFLVTLLYNCYFYNRNIPVRKMQFYEEIYSALFKHHDLSKDKFERLKRSGLDIYNFRLVLRKFAFDNARNNDADFSEASLVEAIVKAKVSLVGVPAFDPLFFAEDIVKRVPLLVKEGLHIKWSHKSLQDYFAAEYICSSERKSVLVSAIFKSPKLYKYYNMIDFIIEMDYSLVRDVFLYDFLANFISFVEVIKRELPALDFEEVKIRAALLYMRKIRIFGTSFFNEELKRLAHTTLAFLDHRDGSSVISFEEEGLLSIIDIIHRKKMDDIFISKKRPNKDMPNKVNDFFGENPKAVLLNDCNASCYSKEEDFIFVNKVMAARNRKPLLDYDKVLAVKEDIELQRSRQAYEESISF